MKKQFLIPFFLLMTILQSCGKTGGGTADNPDQVDENDNVFPVLTVIRPAANQLYTSGDSIIIEGNATDNKVMYKGKVQLKNDVTGSVVAEQFYETHFLKTLNFRVAYKAVVAAATEFTVILDFTDHGLNNVNNTFKVKVNP